MNERNGTTEPTKFRFWCFVAVIETRRWQRRRRCEHKFFKLSFESKWTRNKILNWKNKNQFFVLFCCSSVFRLKIVVRFLLFSLLLLLLFLLFCLYVFFFSVSKCILFDLTKYRGLFFYCVLHIYDTTITNDDDDHDDAHVFSSAVWNINWWIWINNKNIFCAIGTSLITHIHTPKAEPNKPKTRMKILFYPTNRPTVRTDRPTQKLSCEWHEHTNVTNERHNQMCLAIDGWMDEIGWQETHNTRCICIRHGLRLVFGTVYNTITCIRQTNGLQRTNATQYGACHVCVPRCGDGRRSTNVKTFSQSYRIRMIWLFGGRDADDVIGVFFFDRRWERRRCASSSLPLTFTWSTREQLVQRISLVERLNEKESEHAKEWGNVVQLGLE